MSVTVEHTIWCDHKAETPGEYDCAEWHQASGSARHVRAEAESMGWKRVTPERLAMLRASSVDGGGAWTRLDLERLYKEDTAELVDALDRTRAALHAALALCQRKKAEAVDNRLDLAAMVHEQECRVLLGLLSHPDLAWMAP